MSKREQIIVKEEVGDRKPTRYLKWKEVEPNSIISGIYTGSFTRDSDYGESTTHFLDQGEEVIGMPGTARLNTFLAEVEKGDEIEVEFLGKEMKKTKPDPKTGKSKAYSVNEFNVFRRK